MVICRSIRPDRDGQGLHYDLGVRYIIAKAAPLLQCHRVSCPRRIFLRRGRMVDSRKTHTHDG